MNNREKWKAVAANDKRLDGQFFYGVTSTGIFCRPSCASKPPLEENTVFFDTAQQAVSAGFRPCKRCRPDLHRYQPAQESAEQIKAVVDIHFCDKSALYQALAELGISRQRASEIFQQQYKQTLHQYTDSLRIKTAKDRLCQGDEPVLSIALHLGFESLSSFYAFFRKHTQLAPGEYRRLHQKNGQIVESACAFYNSPLGTISVSSNGHSITAIQFCTAEEKQQAAGNRLTALAVQQLEEYFCGQRKTFQLPLEPAGTPFQLQVWQALQQIPYGQVRSYKQVASLVGNPGASRAVGMANNKNPLLIVVPCHRVVGVDGALVGYAAGLERKQQLLELERSVLGQKEE